MAVFVGAMHATDLFYSTYAVDNVLQLCRPRGSIAVMQAVLSVTVMLVDLSVAIMEVTVSVAIMRLELSTALMQVTVSSNNFIFLSLTDTHIS